MQAKYNVCDTSDFGQPLWTCIGSLFVTNGCNHFNDVILVCLVLNIMCWIFWRYEMKSLLIWCEINTRIQLSKTLCSWSCDLKSFTLERHLLNLLQSICFQVHINTLQLLWNNEMNPGTLTTEFNETEQKGSPQNVNRQESCSTSTATTSTRHGGRDPWGKAVCR